MSERPERPAISSAAFVGSQKGDQSRSRDVERFGRLVLTLSRNEALHPGRAIGVSGGTGGTRCRDVSENPAQQHGILRADLDATTRKILHVREPLTAWRGSRAKDWHLGPRDLTRQGGGEENAERSCGDLHWHLAARLCLVTAAVKAAERKAPCC